MRPPTTFPAETPAPMAPVALPERFRFVRKVGEGGMGLVLGVEDRVYRDVVALKLLKHYDEARIDQFRREFRSIAEVRHPNLVELYELFGDPFPGSFTMELLEGTDLQRRLRGPRRGRGPCEAPLADVARLFAQAAEGLSALHAAGYLHRDVKPVNVHVTREDRVVLLDVGLARPLAWGETVDTLAGTPGYLAPERATGRLTPAIDWYALGVTLFETLSGALPFDPIPGVDLVPREPPPRLADVGIDAPDAWERLVAALLDADPARRAGSEVIETLHGMAGTRPLRVGRPRTRAFVGRTEERARLSEAIRAQGTRLVLVRGTSGIGKSALVTETLGGLEADVTVLRSRCPAREHVPFKALDPVAEQLASAMTGFEGTWEGETSSLATLFPVLRRVPAIEARADEPSPADPLARRAAAFRELRALMVRASSERRMVLWIDDFQWSDPDSVLLLEALFRPPEPPSATLVLCVRTEGSEADDTTARLRRLVELFPDRVEIGLGPLGPAEAAALVAEVSGGWKADPSRLAEAGGEPFLLEDLALAAAGAPGSDFDPRDFATRRLTDLPAAAGSALDTIVLAGQPLPTSALAEAAGLGTGARAILRDLEQRALVRVCAGPELSWEPYHDRVRAARSLSLPPERRTGIHGRLLETLQSLSRTDARVLVDHALGAGRTEMAATLAARAGHEAVRGLAFETALALFRIAAEHQRGVDTLTWVAEALVFTGRLSEAGDTYLEAARLLAERPDGGAEAERLQRLGAEQYLHCGRVADGMAALEPVLAAHGMSMPPTAMRATFSALGHRLRFFVRGMALPKRPRAHPGDARRLDHLWAISTALGMIDPPRADAFGSRHLVEALRLGDPSRVARAFGFEASFEALFGGAFFRRRADRLLAAASNLADATGDPYDRAWTLMAACTVHGLAGEFEAAAEAGRRAEALYRSACRGVDWELMVVRTYLNGSLAWLGEVDELTERVPAGLEDAERRGDTLAAVVHRVGQPSTAWLWLDRPEVVLEDGERALAPWRSDAFQAVDYFQLLGVGPALLYTGQASAAHERIRASWRAMQRAGFLSFPYCNAEMLYLRGRAEAASGAGTPASLLGMARALDRLALPHAAGFAHTLRALGAGLAGERSAEAAALLQARAAYVDAGLRLHAAAAEWAFADREGRDADAREMAARVRGLGVRAPERLLATLVPRVASRRLERRPQPGQHELGWNGRESGLA